MKKQFSVNLFDILPKNAAYVNLDEEIRTKLFSRIGNGSLAELSRELDIDIRNLSRYKLGKRNIPLQLLLTLIEKADMHICDLQSRISIGLMRTGKQLDVGPCLTLDNEWVYVAELIRGDGHISDNLWYIYFINKNRRLINIVKRFFIRIGVDKKSIDIRTVNGVANLVVRTNLLAYLLKHIFNVPTGRKGEMNLPGFYRNSKEFAVAAIRAAFDAEGTVSIGNPSPRRIVITSISKNWLFDLKELLLLFKINSEVHYEDRHETAPIYRLRIYGQTQLKSFLNVIGSAHSERLLKLKTLLKTYSENRVPEGSMKVKVLEVLRAKKPMKRQQIASALNFKKKLLGWHLNSLKQNGLVEIAERVYTNRGSYFKYRITDLGLAELTNESGPQ